MGDVSKIAFEMNVDRLADTVAGQTKLFFWTFTFPEVLETHIFKARWKRFIRKMKEVYPAMKFMRVFELHPGEDGDYNGHGFHVHALFPVYRNVENVRKIAESCGIGRVHVKVLKTHRAKAYLAKYLSKTKRENAPKLLRGVRLWQTVNWPEHTKCKNIVRVTFTSWLFRRLKSVGGVSDFEFRKRVRLEGGDLLTERVEYIQSWDDHHTRQEYDKHKRKRVNFRMFKERFSLITEHFYELAQIFADEFNEYALSLGSLARIHVW